MNIQVLTILSIILLIISIVLLIWAIRNEIKLRKFLKGKSANSLEGVIKESVQDIEYLKNKTKEIENAKKELDKRIKDSIRGVGVVRFNPFKGSGGDQSFAIALLDENKNGIVLSSIYSRERVSVYTKPIESMSSSYELTQEEKEALNKAENNVKK